MHHKGPPRRGRSFVVSKTGLIGIAAAGERAPERKARLIVDSEDFLLSKSDPLRWAPILLFGERRILNRLMRVVASFLSLAATF